MIAPLRTHRDAVAANFLADYAEWVTEKDIERLIKDPSETPKNIEGFKDDNCSCRDARRRGEMTCKSCSDLIDLRHACQVVAAAELSAYWTLRYPSMRMQHQFT